MLDIDFPYLYIVTLTLKIWPQVNVMILWSWTTMVWNIIQIKHYSTSEFLPGKGLWHWLCVQCDLENMTLVQGHNTSLGYGQQLCEILSKSDFKVESYGTDKDYGYVCTVTLTLEIWLWFKVMTHLWVEDNNRVKYYSDPTKQ